MDFTLPKRLILTCHCSWSNGERERFETNSTFIQFQFCFVHCHSAGRTKSILFWHVLIKTTGSAVLPNSNKKKKKMQWGGKKLKVKLRALVFSTDTALPLVTFQSRWCYCLWYDTIVQWEKSCRHLNLSMLSTFERKRIRGKSWLQAETIANTLEEASASAEQLP